MFLVCSSLLGRSNDQALIHHILTTVRFLDLCDDNALLEWLECQHKEHLLRQISRDRFFADGEFWRSSLPLKDVRNAQDEIFRSSKYLWKWKYLCGKVEIFLYLQAFPRWGFEEEQRAACATPCLSWTRQGDPRRAGAGIHRVLEKFKTASSRQSPGTVHLISTVRTMYKLASEFDTQWTSGLKCERSLCVKTTVLWLLCTL